VTSYSIEVDRFERRRHRSAWFAPRALHATLCHDVGRDLGWEGAWSRWSACEAEPSRSGAPRARRGAQVRGPAPYAPRRGLGLPFRTVDLPDGDLARFMRGGEAVMDGGEAPGLVSVTRGKWLLAIGRRSYATGTWPSLRARS